ncbi:DUF6230 family protein [Streptomyces sp. SCSIO 30461]|uniref:DUF6230 family protein n=1 Tax=Streptomyces sp. SCSIO 30461 TaxID=3118085 RepID=UPI0030D27719
MSQVRGGTRWKRFAVVMVPSVAATAAIGVGLAQGALAASFAVSGQEFKVSAGYLKGTGFAQYGGLNEGYESATSDKKTVRPVAVSSFRDATIEDMCQSVVTKIPGLQPITLKLKAGEGKSSVVAKDLYLDVSYLKGDAEFRNIEIGVAAKDTDKRVKGGKGPEIKPGEKMLPGGFAQQADEAVLTDVQQRAWATTAGTFKLGGLNMELNWGDGPKNECY